MLTIRLNYLLLNMIVKFLILLSASFALLHATGCEQKGSVVSIHGFLGAPWHMYYIERGLEAEGWHVTSWGYPSRERTIEEHAASLREEARKLAQRRPGEPIHFVAHSMGCVGIARSACASPMSSRGENRKGHLACAAKSRRLMGKIPR